MLTRERITEVVQIYIMQRAVPAVADKMANELGLPSGSVVFGEKAINIQESDGSVYHVQVNVSGGVVIEHSPK